MYVRPRHLSEAIDLLPEKKWSILAGGTDLYPGLQEREINFDVLDICGLQELHGIYEEDSDWIIGSLTTWTEIADSPLPKAFNALRQASKEIGSIQIQNRATLVGNLCNASPAADGVPPLMVLGANVDLTSIRGVRSISISDLITGNRRTTRHADELVTCVRIPKINCVGSSAFSKLGARKYMIISIVMTAVRLDIDGNGLIRDTAISIGSCSEVAQRMFDLEEKINGKTLEQAIASLDATDFNSLSPITDLRAPKDYRTYAAQQLVKRTLRDCDK